jgi:NADPH:quinone reductase-like Zn-dependent oxidoreductase
MGGAKAEINLAALLARRLSVIGRRCARVRSRRRPRSCRRSSRASASALEKGALAPVVDRVLPLSAAARRTAR